MRFLNLVTADFLKQKRGLIWLFLLVIPLGTTSAMFLDMYIRYDDYLYFRAQEKGVSSWEMLLAENHGVLNWGLFLPVFVAVISAIIHYTETKQGAWKSLLSLPVSRTSAFLSKFSVIVFFSWLLITLNSLGLFLVGKVIGFPEPFEADLYMEYVLYQFAGILGSAAIHNWVSTLLKNQINAILIGFLGMVISMILLFQAPDLKEFSPYLYPYFAYSLEGNELAAAIVGGVLSCAVFLLIGIFEFNRRDIL
ncbi:hypothetical protein C0966_00285 [Bacillus methanolicus]|uniref:ABC transporter permease n=1 Tax=Bacillus methanolicus TaxID=1471 RepID=UPI002380B0A9|nr:ABC transporter permease [Bacillus methanolicus]MDE3837845.1 hypothetical protein [Bacillus methanolicus]